jgi:hypothetical protein
MQTVTDQFDNLHFNEDERNFLSTLADQNKAFDFLVVLLGFAEVVGQPMTPADLGPALAEKAVTISAPTWLDAANGAKNIVAGEASQSVQLFILGSFPGMFGKKPQPQNMPFFKDLAQQYTNILNP